MNRSKIVLLTFLFFGVAVLISHPKAHAQQYAQPQENCVTDFYDPAMYSWLSYRNNCGTAVHVQFVSNRPSGISGSMDINPGGHQNTGRSANEVNAAGGVRRYVCPAGYLAFDTSGKMIMNVAVISYTCKQQ
ncbi:MAG: hypothetical protein ABR976_13795 [Terracidiphilus sp.]|jgi:hypothetical protein